MASGVNDNIPQWKKDLILRKRNQSKCLTGSKQLCAGPPQSSSDAIGRVGQQPNSAHALSNSNSVSVASSAASSVCDSPRKCDKMVQERAWFGDQSDSDEDLHYGPGIVNRLKNRYLSLALRESNVKTRPTILRKATSLENLLEDNEGVKGKPERLFETKLNNGCGENNKNVPNRYRSKHRTEIMKRAHSIETISRGGDNEFDIDCSKPKRESLHEDMLIISPGNGIPNRKVQDDNKAEVDCKQFTRVNRPKRIPPMMNEREKPPADVVKQVKRIFEGRPEQRTKSPHATGEVAAKVATYKNIIVQTKVNKKPLIKQKPANDKLRKSNHTPARPWNEKKVATLPSPIPDVSRINEFEGASTNGHKTSLSETPDIILHSSPAITSPRYRLESTQKFIYEEIKQSDRKPPEREPTHDTKPPQVKFISTESRNNISKSGSSFTYNFSKPLKLDLNGLSHDDPPIPRAQSSPIVIPKEPSLKPALTVREIEKNLINSAKTLQQTSVSVESVVPKVKKAARVQEQNSIVFKFTDRQDVPDYVGNDGRKRAAKIERPKAGEGGIIILPGVSLDESLIDDDDDWMRSLEGPPSPCDVTFINDNILIDGRSSFSQRTKKQKLKISFVEAVPEIFEYPSETSMLDDTSSAASSTNGAAVGHSVPSLAGSSLANYMPKGGLSVEEFQLGVTRAVVNVTTITKLEPDESVSQAEEHPILFSAGTNSDMLF